MAVQILLVQHSDADPPGRVGEWLTAAGCHLSTVRCHLGEPLPTTLAGFEGLVVLGGEMGAYDDATTPWLAATKALLARAAAQDLPTLAICLGHQLLAVATGGRVETAPAPQTGIKPVLVTSEAHQDPLFADLPAAPAAVHWNNDLVVTAPPGSVVLSHSDATVQAVRLGSSVWGVQFHPEVDAETVAGWAAEDVAAGRQDADVVRAQVDQIASVDEELQAIWGGFTTRFARWVLERG
jgi:GMP synthase (glutamine-hydrolysing)